MSEERAIRKNNFVDLTTRTDRIGQSLKSQDGALPCSDDAFLRNRRTISLVDGGWTNRELSARLRV